MHQFCIVSIICISLVRGGVANLSIPETLSIGVSTSSVQVEGAWNTSGKGESVWDAYIHAHPDKVADGSNMDIASDSYHNYKEDVQLIKNIGFAYYRFSISWPRILPTGFANNVNEEGIQYYINLIEELLANGIEPVVTLFHFDHPQILEEMGGWTNELIVQWFTDYARIAFQRFGPRVKLWNTVNEPYSLCMLAYKKQIVAPCKTLGDVGPYLCMHNVIKAHAAAWHIYDKEFRAEQQGQVGLVASMRGWMPNSTVDPAIEQNFLFNMGWLMHPLYFGDYPEIMKTRIEKISKLQGYPRSRLPEFTEDESESIKGTVDYFGMNHYTVNEYKLDPVEEFGNYTIDSGIIASINESWPASKTSPWLRYTPPGIREVLVMVKKQYNNPEIHIYENGWSDDGRLNDTDRIKFFHGYLEKLIAAINEDGCNVTRYSVWSLIDNYELLYGYTARFGVVSVNFTDPNRPRTPKLSATWWNSVLKTRVLQDVPASDTHDVIIP